MISVEQHLGPDPRAPSRSSRPSSSGVLDAQGCVLAADVAGPRVAARLHQLGDGRVCRARRRRRRRQPRSARSSCRSSTTSPPATPTPLSLATGPDHADHDRRPDAAGRRRRRAGRGDRRRAWCGWQSASAARSGQHVREEGEDVEAGDVRPARAAPCSGPGRSPCWPPPASPGCGWCPRPRVVVLSTGDELVEVGPHARLRPDRRLQLA